jgi:two-component system sensor histidine kinase PilS (NtrC family)
MLLESTHTWQSIDNPSQSVGRSVELWRSLYFLNGYRLLLSSLLFTMVWVWGNGLELGQRDLRLFYQVNIVYIVVTLALFPLIKFQWLSFNKQLGLQIGTDIVCLVLLSYASGGVSSNLSVLLLVSLAAAGLICRGRITLFFAALASIAVLLEHSYSVLTQNNSCRQAC